MQWRDDLLFDKSTLVGVVNNNDLLNIPEYLQEFACRNNRLLHTAAM